MPKQRYQVSIQHDRPVADMIHYALEDLGGLNQLIPVGLYYEYLAVSEFQKNYDTAR